MAFGDNCCGCDDGTVKIVSVVVRRRGIPLPEFFDDWPLVLDGLGPFPDNGTASRRCFKVLTERYENGANFVQTIHTYDPDSNSYSTANSSNGTEPSRSGGHASRTLTTEEDPPVPIEFEVTWGNGTVERTTWENEYTIADAVDLAEDLLDLTDWDVVLSSLSGHAYWMWDDPDWVQSNGAPFREPARAFLAWTNDIAAASAVPAITLGGEAAESCQAHMPWFCLQRVKLTGWGEQCTGTGQRSPNTSDPNGANAHDFDLIYSFNGSGVGVGGACDQMVDTDGIHEDADFSDYVTPADSDAGGHELAFNLPDPYSDLDSPAPNYDPFECCNAP